MSSLAQTWPQSQQRHRDVVRRVAAKYGNNTQKALESSTRSEDDLMTQLVEDECGPHVYAEWYWEQVDQYLWSREFPGRTFPFVPNQWQLTSSPPHAWEWEIRYRAIFLDAEDNDPVHLQGPNYDQGHGYDQGYSQDQGYSDGADNYSAEDYGFDNTATEYFEEELGLEDILGTQYLYTASRQRYQHLPSPAYTPGRGQTPPSSMSGASTTYPPVPVPPLMPRHSTHAMAAGNVARPAQSHQASVPAARQPLTAATASPSWADEMDEEDNHPNTLLAAFAQQPPQRPAPPHVATHRQAPPSRAVAVSTNWPLPGSSAAQSRPQQARPTVPGNFLAPQRPTLRPAAPTLQGASSQQLPLDTFLSDTDKEKIGIKKDTVSTQDAATGLQTTQLRPTVFRPTGGALDFLFKQPTDLTKSTGQKAPMPAATVPGGLLPKEATPKAPWAKATTPPAPPPSTGQAVPARPQQAPAPGPRKADLPLKNFPGNPALGRPGPTASAAGLLQSRHAPEPPAKQDQRAPVPSPAERAKVWQHLLGDTPYLPDCQAFEVPLRDEAFKGRYIFANGGHKNTLQLIPTLVTLTVDELRLVLHWRKGADPIASLQVGKDLVRIWMELFDWWLMCTRVQAGPLDRFFRDSVQQVINLTKQEITGGDIVRHWNEMAERYHGDKQAADANRDEYTRRAQAQEMEGDDFSLKISRALNRGQTPEAQEEVVQAHFDGGMYDALYNELGVRDFIYLANKIWHNTGRKNEDQAAMDRCKAWRIRMEQRYHMSEGYKPPTVEDEPERTEGSGQGGKGLKGQRIADYEKQQYQQPKDVEAKSPEGAEAKSLSKSL